MSSYNYHGFTVTRRSCNYSSSVLIRNHTARQQITRGHEKGLISANELYKFPFLPTTSFHLVLFGQLQLNVAAKILTTMICTSWVLKEISEPGVQYNIKSKNSTRAFFKSIRDHCVGALLEPLANKFVGRNFVNCKMGKGSRSVITQAYKYISN